jgi:hypothetical protein
LRRSLDHLGQTRTAQWLDHDRVVDNLGQAGPLGRGAEELRADSGHHPERTVLTQCTIDEAKKGLLLLGAAAGEQLLSLVDDQQHVASADTAVGEVDGQFGQCQGATVQLRSERRMWARVALGDEG